MPQSRIDPDPAIGDTTGLDDDDDVNARDTDYADGLEYAGFWIRVAATLIDAVLLFIITTPLLVWIYGAAYWTDGRFIHGPSEFVISWVAPAVATVLFWLGWQATPGKMLLSLRVVDAESGETVSVGQAAARYVCYFISMLPLCLGFIWVGVDRRKQGWHDKIAQTVVVRAKDRGPEAVRFGGSNAAHSAGSRSTFTHNSQARWIVAVAIGAALVVVVAWLATLPAVRWVQYREGILSEYRLMQVPVHQPYPPSTVCFNGYLERVNLRTRTSHRVPDDHGRSVPCLP